MFRQRFARSRSSLLRGGFPGRALRLGRYRRWSWSVSTMIPLRTARSVVRWDGSSKHLDRLRRIVRQAAMQSRRRWLPAIRRSNSRHGPQRSSSNSSMPPPDTDTSPHSGSRRSPACAAASCSLGRLRRARRNAVDQPRAGRRRLRHPRDARQTANARRRIDLDASTVDVLAAWHSWQAAEQRAAGIESRGWMFTDTNGEPIHPHSISQSFERIARRAGVRVIRLHDVRHTHATLLIAAGVPVKVVSERLGHAMSAVTSLGRSRGSS